MPDPIKDAAREMLTYIKEAEATLDKLQAAYKVLTSGLEIAPSRQKRRYDQRQIRRQVDHEALTQGALTVLAATLEPMTTREIVAKMPNADPTYFNSDSSLLIKIMDKDRRFQCVNPKQRRYRRYLITDEERGRLKLDKTVIVAGDGVKPPNK